MTTSLRMLSNGNQLFIGIAVGIFLGLCISMFDDDYFLTVNIHAPDPFFNILPSQLTKEKIKPQQNLTLRCIVLLSSGNHQKPEKEFSAILDTWGRDCNEYELNVSSRILLVQGQSSSLNTNDWPLVRYILHYVKNKSLDGDQNERRWTIISDGKSYVHTKNLLDLLERVDDNVPLIIGSRQTKINLLNSIFSNLFPFFGISSTDWPISATISTDVPIILSSKAFYSISRLCGLQSTNLVASWWEKIILFYKINARGVPQHTGRTIGMFLF
uniref:Alpha-1,6-mannosyl-glycoprotein 6-beta-N-acetylglucosaminyltransferase n=1 Tax=Meloidogyne hapla TaxID=6305 RepID=A0A1I8BAV4_MELHA